ncbi:MAG: 2-amino-4-hydroxy-6-hydroxymethyldihydropteridine diphosphokinase [Gammaproteobacteria bacterium]|nr:2-amino-4-hydroxy-6-hydroxymethyldihydropteridine diphosphokinase [Gammaproteobacteria bacterium]
MDQQKETEEHTIYLGMGTNRGNREANLKAAIKALPLQVQVTRQSPIYQTPPWGYTDQPDFLNMVVEGKTTLPPDELISYIKLLEKKIGRTATFRWGPREIDIDILFYNQRVYESEGLEIPHPRMHDRAFVLVPLADLTTEFIHPKLKKSIAELLAEIDTSGITLYSPDNSQQEK